MSFRLLLVFPLILASACLSAAAQVKDANNSSPRPSPGTSGTEKTSPKSAREVEAERLLKERRANAQSLLINLAADARSFNDMGTRARTLARVASLLWSIDPERARTLFHQGWDAAEIVDTETRERAREGARKSGADSYSIPLPVRNEIIRLAARRDRALGEEFIAIMKEDTRRENGGMLFSTQGPLGLFDSLMMQRLDVARQMLEADEIDRAMQFAEPVLGMIGQYTVDFLSSVRERNAAVADDRYAAMLESATTDQLSDANTVSMLSSYLFTPHSYIGYSADGSYTRSFPGNRARPTVSTHLRFAFFQVAAAILSRPLAAPGEDKTTAGHDGQYLVIKRLMPLFEEYAPAELTALLKAQLETLSSLITKETRYRDDDDFVRQGIRPDNMMQTWENQLHDRLDHAKTSTERDLLYLQLASLYVGQGDLRARDMVDEVSEPETRKNARIYIDIRLAEYAVAKKDSARMIELISTGEFDHIYKSWLCAQAAKLLSKSENDKARGLVDQAIDEARSLSSSETDAPRAFLAAANAMFVVNQSFVWDTMSEAIKIANSADKFTGEDGELEFRLVTRGGPSYRSHETVPDFDLEGIFKRLADYDYDKAVQLARGLNRDAPRSVATIAIARTVLEQKQK